MFHRKAYNWIILVLKVTFKSVVFLLELINDMVSREPLRFRKRHICKTYIEKYILSFFSELTFHVVVVYQKRQPQVSERTASEVQLRCSRYCTISERCCSLIFEIHFFLILSKVILYRTCLSVPPLVILLSFLLAASLIKAHLLHVLISPVVAP